MNNTSILSSESKIQKAANQTMFITDQNLIQAQQPIVQPFSVLEAFYKFKGQIIQNSHILDSLSKNLFAIETKSIQTFFYKEQMLGRVLQEKAEIKKCYQFSQHKQLNQQDRGTKAFNAQAYMMLKSQNEYLKRYISEYHTQYFSRIKNEFDEAKVIRMTAYFMNQFSQKLVAGKDKTPNQHLREMFC